MQTDENTTKRHGGARANAGRKPRVPNKCARALVDRAAAEGLMPSEIMLKMARRMELLYRNRHRDPQGKDFATSIKLAGEVIKATAEVAPYYTPKLSPVARPISIELSGTIAEKIGQIERAVSDGRLSADEAARLTETIKGAAAAVDAAQQEQRFAALEAGLDQIKRQIANELRLVRAA